MLPWQHKVRTAASLVNVQGKGKRNLGSRGLLQLFKITLAKRFGWAILTFG